jgi:enoyl-CoA hydratase
MQKHAYHEVTLDHHLATVAFNHPPLNLTTDEVIHERCSILNQFLDDPEVRVIVLTSAVEHHFGAGSDLREHLDASKEVYRHNTDMVLDLVRRFIESDTLSIAAINGNAIGSAADMTLMCDIRVMGEKCYLKWPEAYLGLMPNWGASTLLPMLVGRSHALEWLLTGRKVYAKDLLKAGLLHSVHPTQDVLEKAQNLAREMCAADQESVKAIKSTVLHSFFMPLRYAFIADAEISQSLFGEPENIERAQAFLDHRMTRLLEKKSE